MPRSTRAFIAAAVLLWGTVGLSAWVRLDWHLMLLAGCAGSASAVLAGVMFTRDREKDALVHALADLSLRRGLRQTRPLKRIV
jgi:hypothetical protein